MPPRSRTTLPLVQPIVPVLRGVPFDDPDWLFEPKYDGFRGLLYVSPRSCWFRSKRGTTMTRFQELAEQGQGSQTKAPPQPRLKRGRSFQSGPGAT